MASDGTHPSLQFIAVDDCEQGADTAPNFDFEAILTVKDDWYTDADGNPAVRPSKKLGCYMSTGYAIRDAFAPGFPVVAEFEQQFAFDELQLEQRTVEEFWTNEKMNPGITAHYEELLANSRRLIAQAKEDIKDDYTPEKYLGASLDRAAIAVAIRRSCQEFVKRFDALDLQFKPQLWGDNVSYDYGAMNAIFASVGRPHCCYMRVEGEKHDYSYSRNAQETGSLFRSMVSENLRQKWGAEKRARAKYGVGEAPVEVCPAHDHHPLNDAKNIGYYALKTVGEHKKWLDGISDIKKCPFSGETFTEEDAFKCVTAILKRRGQEIYAELNRDKPEAKVLSDEAWDEWATQMGGILNEQLGKYFNILSEMIKVDKMEQMPSLLGQINKFAEQMSEHIQIESKGEDGEITVIKEASKTGTTAMELSFDQQ